MQQRYVIGIDSSTQSVKVIAWDRQGKPCAEGRAPLDILQPDALRAEQDAESWWTATSAALRQVADVIDPASIDGIGISNQRETMALLDADDRPLAPATLWLDRRAKDVVQAFAGEIGHQRLHAISGKPIDVIPCVYRLRYWREHQPELLRAVAKIVDVHGFLTLKLTGQAAASWTSADPFGLFDISTKEWSSHLLDQLDIPTSKLPPAFRPGSAIGQVTPAAAAVTGLRPGTAVFAAGGDGHCAGLGVGAVRPGIAYLNLGTAVVGGVWSPTADLSSYWRTLISPTGEGYLLEACQRAGAFFVNWFIDNFAGGRSDPSVFRKLEEAAARLPVGSDGVLVCSYLLGCMDPHWDENTGATFTGLGPAHGSAHLYRASLEAITLEFARAITAMKAAGRELNHILAIGGGADSRLWLKMIADSTGLPVIRSLSNEASALGAGISAAVGAGWYDGFDSATRAMTHVAEQVAPDPAERAAWDALSARQEKVYRANRG